MALSELNAAIPEKLPVKFAYNELGHRFESVQSKRLVQLLPQGAQPFGPKHTRLVRFNLTATSGDYPLPESVRLQAIFRRLRGWEALQATGQYGPHVHPDAFDL